MARDLGSSSDIDTDRSVAGAMTSPPSSPPPEAAVKTEATETIAVTTPPTAPDDLALIEAEERRARKANAVEEERRVAAQRRRSKKTAETKAAREAKARELDELLRQSAAFSDILTKKTQALGRVGTGLDGQKLGEHDLQMAQQPACLVGGTMRDYQLEGLTWMLEICLQNMSGILADEMGLGKTVQTISLIALLREQEHYLGPHLIVAPLSTLGNWMAEFARWTPSIPVVLYHGTPAQRKALFRDALQQHLAHGRPTERFPVVCTSYEIILRDRADLSKINWEFIIIDEGHRMKNFDSKLFRELQAFRSATRFLITGTPLQNNLKELWSLLNFLMPNIFTDWEAFSSWFDFSELQDEASAAEFVEDRRKQDLVKKIHLVLQPLLLRRVKADVARHLPKKREYILYAPLTSEQDGLYRAISDKTVDTRAYLETAVAAQLAEQVKQAAGVAREVAKGKPAAAAAATQTRTPVPIRSSPRGKGPAGQILPSKAPAPPKKDAFALLMGKARPAPAKKAPANPAPEAEKPAPAAAKRKTSPTSEASQSKSARSSRHSTPGSRSTRGAARGRARRTTYREVDASDEDALSDDAFEAALREEITARGVGSDSDDTDNDDDDGTADLRAQAKRELANKKLGNPVMQLRLVCNSPHNFYSPWAADPGRAADETLVAASGKMRLLDRLLPALFARGHKVLIFSQFKTQLDLLELYGAELRGWRVCRIDGSVAHAARQAQIEAFNRDPGCRLFLLSTRAGGQGINLASADTVVLFDSDWNPQQDLQAQDRAHRIGQTRPVVVYRLATQGTVEEALLLSADAKRRLEKLVIKKGGFRSMGQKMGEKKEAQADGGRDDDLDDLDAEALRALLLRDGQVYTASEDDRALLSDHDLDVLCDRSDEAYARAARGQGDADAFRVVETGADGLRVVGGAA